MSVVRSAVLAAKEEMREYFWKTHVRYKNGGTVTIVPLEKLATECQNDGSTLVVLTDGTYTKSASTMRQLMQIVDDHPSGNPDVRSRGFGLTSCEACYLEN